MFLPYICGGVVGVDELGGFRPFTTNLELLLLNRGRVDHASEFTIDGGDGGACQVGSTLAQIIPVQFFRIPRGVSFTLHRRAGLHPGVRHVACGTLVQRLHAAACPGGAVTRCCEVGGYQDVLS